MINLKVLLTYKNLAIPRVYQINETLHLLLYKMKILLQIGCLFKINNVPEQVSNSITLY